MQSHTHVLLFLLTGLFISSCGGGDKSSEQSPIIPEVTHALVSFSVSDAPVDSVSSVNVTFDSLTLKSGDDSSDIDVPILDDDDNPTTITVDLMMFQDGETKLIIENTLLPIGEYSNLIINTSGCPQNQNGSTEFCWVEDSQGIKPLKTPSNKLKLGPLTISDETEQSFTIEFNLRSSLVMTANGASYNLKPHGVRVVDTENVGSLTGSIDVNLLNAGEGCETAFDEETDHGKIVYLYNNDDVDENDLADVFDPEEAENEIPDNLAAPFASESISFDEDSSSYQYGFHHLPTGSYLVAFSCSAVGDDPDEFDGLSIPNPESQSHLVEIVAGANTEQDFEE